MPHREARDLDEATRQSGLMTLKVEASALLNLSIGPWGEAARFGQMQGAAKDLWRLGSADLPLFQLLYKDICAEQGAVGLEVGTKEHMVYMWGFIQTCPLFLKKGMKSKLGRWYSWEPKSEEMLPWRSTLLLVLLWEGIQKKWWKNISETPMFCEADSPADEDAEARGDEQGEGAAAGERQPGEPIARDTVVASNAKVEALRKTVKHTMHYAAQFLANRPRSRLWAAMVFLEESLRILCGQRLVMQKTRGGNQQLMLHLAKGAWVADLSAVLERLQDMEGLAKLGFLHPSDYSASGCADQELKEDQVLAAHMYTFATELVRSRLLSMMSHSHFLPGYLVLLLDPEPDTVDAALATLKLWWGHLEALELAALADSAVKSWVDAMLFPKLQWVREIMVRLLEAGWGSVPAEVKEELQIFVDSLHSTKPVEDMFNSMSGLSRQHKAGVMGEVTKWHRQIIASVLPEADRPQVPVTAAAHAASSKCVPPHVFDYTKVEPAAGVELFSLGGEVLQTLTLEPAPWPTPSPNSIKAVPASWHFSLQVGGDADKISTAWPSLLAERRTMVYNPTVTSGGPGSSIIRVCFSKGAQ